MSYTLSNIKYFTLSYFVVISSWGTEYTFIIHHTKIMDKETSSWNLPEKMFSNNRSDKSISQIIFQDCVHSGVKFVFRV